MHEPAKPWPTIRTSRSDKLSFRAMLHLESPDTTLLSCKAGVNFLRVRCRCSAVPLFRTAQLCRQPTQSDGTGRGSASPALGTAIVGGCSSRRSSFWNTMTHGQRMGRASQACSSRLSEAHSAQFPLCRRGLTDTGSAEPVPERPPVFR